MGEIESTTIIRPYWQGASNKGGRQLLFRFPNGYGASIIHDSGSYGVELAVIKWDGENWWDFHLDKTTPVTAESYDGAVLPHQDETSLRDTLIQIMQLPATDELEG